MGKVIPTGITVLALLAGCAQSELTTKTESGNPEVVIKNATPGDVRNRLVKGCASKGVEVLEASEFQVVCGKQLKGGQATMATLAIGNAYSTTPIQKVKFTIFQDGDGVKVVANQWIESQMPGGQTNRMNLTSNAQNNDLQQALNKLTSPPATDPALFPDTNLAPAK